MQDYIFTFGYGQIPGIGMFCRIQAETHWEARQIMGGRTTKFAPSYSSEEKAGVEKFHLIEVYWDDLHKGWSDHKL